MTPDPVATFITRWSDTERAERANKDLFLTELCDLLDLPHPDPAGPDSSENAYVFERAVPLHQPDGRATTGKIDLYRRACFVLEAKQTAADARPENQPAPAEGELALDHSPAGSTRAPRADLYGRAMLEARTQAERYARNLPASEPPPPFVVVVDVGHSFELFADFTQKGKAFLPFPDARSHRVLLGDLRDEKIRARLRLLWLDPTALDPAKTSAAVTREAARRLAALAQSFEHDRHDPRTVSAFLTRCLFCMFAEDIGLLPREGFRGLLESLQRDRAPAAGVAATLEQLFRELDRGTPFSTVLRVKLLHFNGGLFSDATALAVGPAQLDLLVAAARLQWSEVEPAIFGTLLERALDPAERHKLGAHYTPRAYVERIVLPTVIEPLRAEWANVLASALSLAESGRTARAQADIFKFHRRLCSLRVLDPACGCGNFLYVTLAHFKILEGEVLDAYERFGGGRRTEQGPRAIGAATVDPHQFLGIGLNPRAASIAELVLWIGYLQWHFRTFGAVAPAEPVLRNFKNIEHRDAVLAYDGPPEIVTRAMIEKEGPAAFPGLPENLPASSHPIEPITLWDRRSVKRDAASGREIPDESKRVPFYRYANPRPADWPATDYIVGNPPFLGSKMMRNDLGEAYTATLRAAYPALPETADFVMYWWHKAAALTRAGAVKRFGFITTNSLRQTSSRRIVADHIRPEKGDPLPALALRFAIPDHPWVDTADGAAVRIAMTVGELAGGDPSGELVTITSERPNRDRLRELRRDRNPPEKFTVEEEPGEYGDERNDDGSLDVTLSRARGNVAPDLTLGADVSSCVSLRSNSDLAFMGAKLVGDGFVVTSDAARALGLGAARDLDRHIKPFRNGRDLTEVPRGALVIDLYGLSEAEVRERFPKVFQHLFTTVKPQRDLNKRASYRENWWVFAEPRGRFRASVAGLSRYIATSEVGKHRFFVFLDATVFPDGALIATNLDDALHLGVLSSRIHVTYALAAGGTLEDRPRYQATRCFDPFPFPVVTEKQAARIRAIAEEIDAHRKRAQAKHGAGLTAIYNVLVKLRAGTALTTADKNLNDIALVATLRHLHEQLDAAVAEAYGWPVNLTDEEILERIVTLNATRAAEEARGQIRWLRPEFQAPTQAGLTLTTRPAKPAKKSKPGIPAAKKSRAKPTWPQERPAQVEAVATALAAATAPVSAADLAATFARGKKETVAEILAALVTLGRARRAEKRGTFTAA
ncbi:MAG: class I SAM-dependent DNA methyltransferase [Undibacterium sp.]|nr:class I SAM-dependent DNA methyltransferase [Opitutaceae bacterium]